MLVNDLRLSPEQISRQFTVGTVNGTQYSRKECLIKAGDIIECPICYETFDCHYIEVAPCGHMFCKTCYENIDRCAMCRGPKV